MFNDTEDLMNLELYDFIGTVPTASVKEIKTAYRKKALSCHPDKNPNDPKAAELFQKLSRVLEILIDDSARAAYDKVVNAKKQAKLRVTKLDSKRRKFKEELEAREEAHKRSEASVDEQRLKVEIERLKKEGSRQVEEEIAFVKNQMNDCLKADRRENVDGGCGRVKIRWKSDKNDDENGGYNYDLLHNILSKYGDIAILVISNKKKGSALVEYRDKSAAVMATQIEIGLAKNPLSLQGLWACDLGNNRLTSSANKFSNNSIFTSNISPSINQTSKMTKKNSCLSFSSAPNIFHTFTSPQSYSSDVEYEKCVLNNMRRAEERKRLLEQMQDEDE